MFGAKYIHFRGLKVTTADSEKIVKLDEPWSATWVSLKPTVRKYPANEIAISR